PGPADAIRLPEEIDGTGGPPDPQAPHPHAPLPVDAGRGSRDDAADPGAAACPAAAHVVVGAGVSVVARGPVRARGREGGASRRGAGTAGQRIPAAAGPARPAVAHTRRASSGGRAGVAVAARLSVGLESAARGAAVAVDPVAVVAFLAGIDVAVAAAPELPGHHGTAAGRLRLPPHHHHVAGTGDADGGARVLDARIGSLTHRERRALQAAIAPEA